MNRKPITPRFILFLLTALVLSGAFSIISSLQAQNQKKKEIQKRETFNRPAPTKPIKPTIPSADRYQDDKVFLENADSLYRPASYSDEEKQIVKGNVKFRQGSMWMFCDSAYYFPERNSLDAFGHVVMQQGDTLFVYADKLFYDGLEKHAILTDGPSQRNVIMKDPKVTLTTDSLDYDLNQEIGWYSTGGKLEDDMNVLTSQYGEYSPATKQAAFKYDVVMVNNKDGFTMYTEELDYNTETHIADINTATRIEGKTDTILTTSGQYNTATDNAVLMARSTIIHRDSADNIITLEGDSIIYDKAKRVSKAYMFRSELKQRLPMVLTDTARKMTLIGGYGEYDDSLQRAFSTEYPLLMEYSRPDTLFLRADTILTSIRTELVWPDSLSRNWSAETRTRLRSYTSLSQIAEEMILSISILPTKFQIPGEHRVIENIRHLINNDKPVTDNILPQSASPHTSEVKPSDQNAGKNASQAVFSKNEESLESLDHGHLAGNEIPDSVIVSDTTLVINSKRLDALGRDSSYMIPKEYHRARAIGRARFFKQDLQGIADTMLYEEFDSILYLIHKPVVWSGERQVYGGQINVHFNDSVADWAFLPNRGFVAEHIDEDLYNQLAGKQMTAYFENNELRHLFVDGNVESIFLPMENDSTYNKLVNAESSYMTVDMSDRTMRKLKMWPAVEMNVIPIFLLKKTQQYLQGFQWYEPLRPRREWYGDRWHWIDNLGEVPDDLERYFQEAPVIRNLPKSPFAQ